MARKSGSLVVRGTKTKLVDQESLGKLQTAATAAGLELEQLADLVADSGLLTLPPSDGITARFTVEDLGASLHQTMLATPQDEWPQWFQSLLPVQQIALVTSLRSKGYSCETVGKCLDLPMLKVNQVWNEYADALGAQVVGLRLNTIAGNLQLMAERAQQGLMEKEDWKGYWMVARSFLDALQSLGIVDSAVHRVEVTHKFDEGKQAEIEALIDLEKKKRVRIEEIKQADALVYDTLPQVTVVK